MLNVFAYAHICIHMCFARVLLLNEIEISDIYSQYILCNNIPSVYYYAGAYLLNIVFVFSRNLQNFKNIKFLKFGQKHVK